MRKFLFLYKVMINNIVSMGRPWLYISGLSIVYIFIQLINIFLISLFFIVFYEIFLNIFILINEYIFSLLKFSIIYLFFYFLICFFNIRYRGYYQFKFFGLSLNYPKIFLKKFWIIFKEYNYFFLVLIHVCLLNLIIFSIYDNVLFFINICIIYIFIIISIQVKIKWNNLDLNYKTKVWNLGLNMVLILIIGFYINLIIEYLVPSFILKINGFDYFWKTFQNKWIFNFNFQRSNARWLNLYGLKKEYFVNMFFFNFKKNLNDQYILYNYNSIKKNNIPLLKKDYDKNILNYINYNNINIMLLQESLQLDKINILELNLNNNNISINEEYDSSFYKDYDIKKILGYEAKPYEIFNIFNFKNFLYNKYNFIIQTHLEKKDIYPIEENNFVLKNLLKRDKLNYNYLLLDSYKNDNDNNDVNLIYEEYINLSKSKIKFYNNISDLLLLRKDWEVFNLIKFKTGIDVQILNNYSFLDHIKIEYLPLLEFNQLLYYFNNIDTLLTKFDLFILNWENKQLTIKNYLIKEEYIPNNFNVKKVLKDLLIGLRNNPNDLLIKNINMEKNKISKYINIDDFLDFVELLFDKSNFNKIFKIDLFRNFIFEEQNNIIRNAEPKYNTFMDWNILKKQLEEFGYQKYTKKFIFTFKDLDAIFNLYYILEDNNIYEIDIRNNIINIISNNEYENKMFNIKMYQNMILSKNTIFIEGFWDKIKLAYMQYIQNVNKYFPKEILKNNLLNKIISYYENKLILFADKDKFLFLNNMKKIIYFFHNKGTTISNQEHSHLLSFYNIQKLSMSYLHYHHLKANFNFLYNYDIYPNVLYKHLHLQYFNMQKFANIQHDIEMLKDVIIYEEVEDIDLDFENIVDETDAHWQFNENEERILQFNDNEEKIYYINENEEAEEASFEYFAIKQMDEYLRQLKIEKRLLEKFEHVIDTSKVEDFKELDEYINENLQFFYSMFEDNMDMDDWLESIKEYLFEESQLIVYKNPILQDLITQHFFYKKELDGMEDKLLWMISEIKAYYGNLMYTNTESLKDILKDISDYERFMRGYRLFENSYNKDLQGIKDDISMTKQYKTFLILYNDILNDIEKLNAIHILFKDKENWINYLKDTHDYTNIVHKTFQDSRIYQLSMASLDNMFYVYMDLIFNYKHQLELIINMYDNYIDEVDYTLDYIKTKFHEYILSNDIQISEYKQNVIELELDEVDDLYNIKSSRKELMELQVKKLHDLYFNEVLKIYPNIKYKNLLELDKALVNKDWDLYKRNRLYEEHWNKNFKDFNNIIKKKPYEFRKFGK